MVMKRVLEISLADFFLSLSLCVMLETVQVVQMHCNLEFTEEGTRSHVSFFVYFHLQLILFKRNKELLLNVKSV